MEIEESFCQLSPTNPFLNNLDVEFAEDEDNETVIDFELTEDNQTIDELNQIERVITEDIEDIADKQLDQNNGNDSDVEIVANCGEDDLLLGSQLVADKYLKSRQNSERNDVHKECKREKEKRIQFEIELELERQQRIQFQKQLEDYMSYSLRKQFEDSKQIKSLKFELLKCRQQLKSLKKSSDSCEDINSNNDFDSNGSPSTNPSKEGLTCLDCSSQMKSEVSMILHLINHCIEEEEFQLESNVFRLDELTDSMADSIRKSVSYCCPRCTLSFNCLDIYYHLYKCHTKEIPLICTKCKVYCTHLDYWKQHNQTAHNGAIQCVTYIDIAKHNRQSQPQPQPQRSHLSQTYFNGTGSTNTFKSYSINRSNARSSGFQNNYNRVSGKVLSSFESNSRSMSRDGSESPEIIQLSDSPPPPSSSTNRSLHFGSTSGAKTKVNDDFVCDFPDCDFKTISKDKLDFHTSAHTNSKFKCPYCPYVGNILNDIYRHITKSKKHDGMKVYECRDCSYGTNCVSSFKEHLHKKHFDNDSDDDDEQDINEYITDMFRNQHSTTNDDNKSSDES